MSGGDEIVFELHHAQQLVMQDQTPNKVMACGRRWGKDHLAPTKIMVESYTKESPRGAKRYAYLNPVYNPQGKDSFRTFLALAESAGLVKHKVATPPQEIILETGDSVSFFSMENPDNLRGGQYDGIVINEAGLIANLKEIHDGPVAAMLLDRKGWLWMQGTPKGKNAFHKFFLLGQRATLDDGTPNRWKSFRFPTSTNPFIDKTELERLRKELPADIFAQEFLAEFLDGAGGVFKGLEALRARGHGLDLLPQADNCRVGVDIAKHTDFTVLIALSPDNKVIGYDRFNQLDWPIIERRIVSFCSRYRGRMIMDATGVGDPIYSSLVQRNLPVLGVKLTNDRKTQIVQNLMLLIEQGVLRIPYPGSSSDPARDLSVLWEELEAYAYEVTSTGKIRYSAPTGFHDDTVTALCLAASEPPPIAGLSGGSQDLDLNDIREIGETSDAYS